MEPAIAGSIACDGLQGAGVPLLWRLSAWAGEEPAMDHGDLGVPCPRGRVCSHRKLGVPCPEQELEVPCPRMKASAKVFSRGRSRAGDQGELEGACPGLKLQTEALGLSRAQPVIGVNYRGNTFSNCTLA